jgi:hypothetical protein
VVSRPVAALAAIAFAGCFDFGRFNLPDGGDATDLARTDLAGPRDLAPTDLAPACTVAAGNLLVGNDTSFDNGIGNWTGSAALIVSGDAAGCVGSAVRLCLLGSVTAGTFGVFATIADPSRPYRVAAWLKADAAMIGSVEAQYYLPGPSTSVASSQSFSNATTGWEQLSTDLPAPSPDAGVMYVRLVVSVFAPGRPGACLDVDQAWMGAE